MATLTGTAGADSLTGSTAADLLVGLGGDDTLTGGAGADTLTGGSGNDTYVVDVIGDVITEGLNEGSDTIKSNFTYSLAAVANVEKLVLTGSAVINATGSIRDDHITGNAAANIIDGGAGADTMIGGDGNDTYIVDNLSDVVSETSAITNQLDTIETDLNNYVLGTNIENLTITGTATTATGNTRYNKLIGNANNNTLTGLAGNDTLDGGAGNDTLVGGTGNDTYIIDVATDVITEVLNVVGGVKSGGIDTVIASVDFALDLGTGATTAAKIANTKLENLILDGSATTGTGNLLANVLKANDTLASTLSGLAGNDTLDGSVGAGADTLIGGAGADTYNVGLGDIISGESDSTASTEIDKVIASVSYSLDEIANVEKLTLTGTANIDGKGNALNNTINGNTGNNSLDGGDGNDTLLGNNGADTLTGGSGTDNLTGGSGNDTYNVNLKTVVTSTTSKAVLQDAIIEATGTAAGIDTVIIDNFTAFNTTSTITIALNTENLDASATGDAQLNLTGNSSNNSIIGNDFGNKLNGGANNTLGQNGNDTLDGGAGNDTMTGGTGNDTYLVDSLGDSVVEAASGGADTIQTGINYSLAALSQVENLTLTGSAISATGNTGNNVLTGNTGNNTLDGGAGNDTMTGGTGNDTYVVDSLSDVVTELASGGTDTIQTDINNYSLAALSQVENLTLTGSAISATGNTGNNVLTGNTGNNTLDGGAGDDTMTGGTGNDTYVVGSLGDSVVEALDEGTDTIQTSITYSLAALADVENLTLTGSATTATGNTGNNVLTGNTGNNTLDGGAGDDTMTGGTGNDTYVVDSLLDVVTELASAGTDSIQTDINYSIVALAQVENLTLTGFASIATGNTGNNVLTGNSGNNTLNGGDGNDTMTGGLGDDSMTGGIGNDTYVVDSLGDSVVEVLGEGTDTVQSSVTFTLGSEVENLTLIGSGNINATGNTGNNVLTGNTGNNTLDGGLGGDTMTGGAGNDTYVVDSASDSVVESASGTDTVQSSVTFTLGSQVENLTLTGSLNINATGNTGNNVLTGNTGDNTLDGGAGNDTMTGGAGNDTYVVDSASDSVLGDEGTDTVQSSVTFTLGSQVENLTLTGSLNINATGNTGNNVLTGNTGDNALNGGAGDDTMAGGTGDDTYVVDSLLDVVTELASGGTDTIQTGITYSIELLSQVENLFITGSAITATGNTGNNVLTGNTGNNTLEGGAGNDTMYGGLGDDTMTGGTGNDTYEVQSLGDSVVEVTGEGTDTVQSSVSYSLAALADVENLTLTGSANVNATGNAGNNVLTDNAGNNALDGGAGDDTMTGGSGDDTMTGGSGDDTMTGGSGNDIFVFDTTLGLANVDVVTDFVTADQFQLDDAIFGALGLGTLSASSFVSGSGAVAADANDHIIYDTTTGGLYYDADGVGGTAALQFATLTATISSADFTIV